MSRQRLFLTQVAGQRVDLAQLLVQQPDIVLQFGQLPHLLVELTAERGERLLVGLTVLFELGHRAGDAA